MEIAKKGKYLAYSLASEEYGIDISTIMGIENLTEITQLPQTPVFVKGIINLRGSIIPVVDLRIKFSIPEKEYDDRTCIIVVELKIGEEVRSMGIIVDSVSEVIQIDDIDPPPRYSAEDSNDFLVGIGKMDKRVILLVDIQSALSTQEILQLANIS